MPTDSPVSSVENPRYQDGTQTAQGRQKGRSSSQKSGSYLPDIHRSLPQSLEAEQGVLCSILLSPNDVLTDCVEQLAAHHFHHPANASIYALLVELWNSSAPIDLITVTQSLRDQNLLDQVGGAEYITTLSTFLPTAANADFYIDILKEKYLLRQVIVVCTEYAARSYDEQGEAKVLLDEVEAKVLEIGQQRYQGALPTMQDQVMEAMDMIELLHRNRGAVSGLPTGFAGFDKLTSGLHPGNMIVIAARPSMGKTALALNIAEHVAMDVGKPVSIFSLEMSSQELVQRLLCSLARVDLQKLRNGFLTKQDFPNLMAAADKLAKSQIFIDDTAGISILELRAKARRLKDRQDIALIVIDYLQLLKSTSRRAQDNRQLEIAEISAGLKALAKELKIPIVVLAQLNRKPDERGGAPRMSDLRESGSIEQDADVIGLLIRPEVYEKDDDSKEDKAGEAELIIAKQRNGPTGEVPLTFLKEFTRFEDRAFVPDENRG
ncbi:MAG: replicative DNA helicase [Chthoniobacterales bacterium]